MRYTNLVAFASFGKARNCKFIFEWSSIASITGSIKWLLYCDRRALVIRVAAAEAADAFTARTHRCVHASVRPCPRAISAELRELL